MLRVSRYPTEHFRRQIISLHSKDFGIPRAEAALSFARRLIAVPDFLPRGVFDRLRDAAEREARSLRIHIPTHKRGATISYHDLHYCAPELVAFYESTALHDWCSQVIGQCVAPTPLNDLSSCSLLIYDRPADRIGWHFDYDFYRGRHFTGLLSLINANAAGTGTSSARLLVGGEDKTILVPTPPNTMVLFEGAYVNHCVTPLERDERRVILSMTFCTDRTSTRLQGLERRFKDVAYFGLKALWS